MTWADFQSSVLAFLNRSSADIPTIGTVNLVVVAANMSKTEAQRRHAFKMSRTKAYISTSMSGADFTTAAFTTPLSATVVPIRRIEQAWMYANATPYYRYRLIPYMTLGDLKNDYDTSTLVDLNLNSAAMFPSTYPCFDIRWYVQGTMIFLQGVTVPALPISLDVMQWMPQYDGTITDFFLTYHFDWMMLKTVQNLNQYLKESERVEVADSDLERRWKSVTALDENFGEDSFESGGN